MNISNENPVVCWWSGGVTSAVACKIAIDTYGADNCRVIFIDTANEDDDTIRFLNDCEKWYGIKIEKISRIGKDFETIEDVWFDYLSLNVATGAICSSELKREVRKDFQRKNKYAHQVFGFDIDEKNRAENLTRNYPLSRPLFPLIEFKYTKLKAIEFLEKNDIDIPRMYKLGFRNNNCFKTGCVQGGIGYWKKIQKEFPEKFAKMAQVEHELTNLKGKPVTCLRSQKKSDKHKPNIFLLPHPDYPDYKDLSMMKGRKVEPLVECNGFCGFSSRPLF